MWRMIVLLPLFMILAFPAHADFKSGMEAFKRGDYVTAKAEFKALADLGVPAAQTNLGLMYSKGYGMPSDDAQAIRWYRLAADQKQPVAQNNLGFMYLNGQGGPKDRVLGLMWLLLAFENGYDRAGNAVAKLEVRMSKKEVDLARRFSRLWAEKYELHQNMISSVQ